MVAVKRIAAGDDPVIATIAASVGRRQSEYHVRPGQQRKGQLDLPVSWSAFPGSTLDRMAQDDGESLLARWRLKAQPNEHLKSLMTLKRGEYAVKGHARDQNQTL